MTKQELHQKYGPKLVCPLPGPKARAVVAAEYTGYLDPRLIRLTRDGQTSEIKASLLLQGQDMAVQPGDIIELVQ